MFFLVQIVVENDQCPLLQWLVGCFLHSTKSCPEKETHHCFPLRLLLQLYSMILSDVQIQRYQLLLFAVSVAPCVAKLSTKSACLGACSQERMFHEKSLLSLTHAKLVMKFNHEAGLGSEILGANTNTFKALCPLLYYRIFTYCSSTTTKNPQSSLHSKKKKTIIVAQLSCKWTLTIKVLIAQGGAVQDYLSIQKCHKSLHVQTQTERILRGC